MMPQINSRTTVLVVEDDPFVRLDAVDMVEELGYAVLEARNADAAILLLESHPEISIVFTDIDMPGSMDGLKLAHAVRNRWPPVRLIIASGILRPASHEIPVGSMFFSKPYGRYAIKAALTNSA